jgi:hypothetical protein
MPPASHMYPSTKTWNPFKGCKFDCKYSVSSFQAQAKRQKDNCRRCYEYELHEHPKRLLRHPGKDDIISPGTNSLLCPVVGRQPKSINLSQTKGTTPRNEAIL